MSRRSGLVVAGVVVLLLGALVFVFSLDDSPTDIGGVNPGYAQLFKALEASWSFDGPLSVPPDPTKAIRDPQPDPSDERTGR